MSKQSKFAIGAVVAGVAGYVAGVLTAPKSGKETRSDIKTKASDVKHETEHKLEQVQTEVANTINEAKAKVKKIESDAKGELDDLLTKATEAREKAQEVLHSVQSGKSSDKDLQKAIDNVKKAGDHLKKYLAKHG